MSTRARFLTAVAGTAAASTWPTAIFAQSRKPLSIGYVPSTLFAPVFVAVERGYLRDAGFDATLTPIVAVADSISLVAQGQLVVAAAAPSAPFIYALLLVRAASFAFGTGSH